MHQMVKLKTRRKSHPHHLPKNDLLLKNEFSRFPKASGTDARGTPERVNGGMSGDLTVPGCTPSIGLS